MRNSSSLKQEFLRKWIMGLRKCTSWRNNMSFLERKKAIKLSANLAMASTRNEATCWSRALMIEASRDEDNIVLAEQILGSPEFQRLRKVSLMTCGSSRRVRSRKILKRSHTMRRVKKKSVASKEIANSIAKRLVQKRRRKLKSLLPGGEYMVDDESLIEETLDYIESLRAQVEVMRCLATASELITNS